MPSNSRSVIGSARYPTTTPTVNSTARTMESGTANFRSRGVSAGLMNPHV